MIQSSKRQASLEVLALCTLLVLTFLLFSPVLGFDLLWDDLKIATEQVKFQIGGVEDMSNHLRAALPFSPNYWRPLPMASFLWQINSGLGGSTMMHLASVVLHCLNAVLVFKLLGLMERPAGLSAGRVLGLRFLLAGAFALHPLMVEPVAWVSSRFDLMMTFFSLALLFVLFGIEKSRARLGAVFLLYLAALLCKEQAVMLLPAYPFLAILFGQGEILRSGWQRVDVRLDRAAYVTMGLAFLVYLGLRFYSLGYLLLPESLGFGLDPVQHLLVFGATTFHAWGLMLFPFGWAGGMHHFELSVGHADLALWLQTVVVLAGLAFTAWFLLRRTAIDKLGALLVVTWLTLFPVLNVKPLIGLAANMLVSDRFLVLPTALLSLGAYALVAACGAALPARRGRMLVAGLLAFLSLAAVNSHLLLPDWRDEKQLWSAWLSYAPNSAFLTAQVAREMLLEDRYAEAEALSKRAVELLDSSSEMMPTRHWLLGRALSTASIAAFEQGKVGEAIVLMEDAAKRDMGFASLYRSLLARIYLRLGDLPAATQQMAQVARLAQYQGSPRLHSIGYINLALLALERHDWPAAGILFREGYFNLAGGTWATGLPASPAAWERVGRELDAAKLPRSAELARQAAAEARMRLSR